MDISSFAAERGRKKRGRESEQEEGEERRGWKEEAIHKSSGREGPSLIV